MIDKSKDKVGYLKDRFNDCIKNGYEHFGFEGDFSFVFDAVSYTHLRAHET